MTVQRLPTLLVLVLLLASCGGGGGSVVADPGNPNDGTLQSVLDQVRTGHNVPAVAAVLIEGNSIVEIGVSGTRVINEPEAVTTSDQWHIGSISKSITSTLIAIYIERGLLDWDTTVAEVLLSDIPDMRGEYHDVRIEQLMAHTGGLPVDITRSAAVLAGDYNDDSPLPMTARRLGWSADMLRLPPETAIGTHQYSNANYIVLGAIIEKVTGEQWEDLIAREIFAPLGMSNSGFGAPGIAGMRVQPWGHVGQGGSWRAIDPGHDDAESALAIGPAGTIHTTLRDFTAYMAAHLAGERGEDGLLTAATFASLHAPQPGTDYGGGWVSNTDGWAGSPSFWHNGSNGRWFAHTVIAPDRNAAVFVASNSGSRAAVEDLVGVMIRRYEAGRSP
jgi:CubicO group peptidase (beta-lactamase class C family)